MKRFIRSTISSFNILLLTTISFVITASLGITAVAKVTIDYGNQVSQAPIRTAKILIRDAKMFVCTDLRTYQGINFRIHIFKPFKRHVGKASHNLTSLSDDLVGSGLGDSRNCWMSEANCACCSTMKVILFSNSSLLITTVS